MAEDLSLISEDGPWPESTWNFSRIPDGELVACCLWEYARESHTLALASAVHQSMRRQFRRNELPPPTKEELANWAELDARTRCQVKREKFDYNKFLQRFWDSDFGHLRFYDLLRTICTGSAHPYQLFPKKLRRYFVSQVSESTLLQPVTEAFVGDLERLWKENSVHLSEVRATVRPPDDDSEDAARFQRSKPSAHLIGEDEPSGRTRTVALTIDFSRFADAEIEIAFRRWLVADRPHRWRKPAAILPTAVRRGRKLSDYRVALERLGLMRLLHGGTPSDIRTHIPSAWKLYGHKQGDFRREIRAAVRFFRERFPFLPPRERPFSENRFSTWWRPGWKEAEPFQSEQGRK